MGEQFDGNRIKRDLIYKVAKYYSEEYGAMDVSTIVVHPGPKAWKEVSLLTFVDTETGEIHKRELRVQTWKTVSPREGGGYDFTTTEYHWHCEGDEVDAVRAFLHGEFSEPGKYRLIRGGTEFEELVNQVERGEVNPGHIVRLVEAADHAPDMIATLAASRSGSLLAEAVELQRRRDQLDALRRIIEEANATERDHIHPQLKKMGWIFGGRYVGEAKRRQLTTGDVLDVPLLRADGSLHVVELKGANIPALVRRYRGPTLPQEVGGRREELPLIVGTEVHEAVGQVMNYLCHLDEDRDHILTKFKIDTRRASATVLIGHPKFVSGSFTDEGIASTLRTYNSHHSRIEVMHYQDLIENAERALALAEVPLEDQEDEPHQTGESLGFPQQVNELDPWRTSAAELDPWTVPAPEVDPWKVQPSGFSSDEPPF